MMLKLQDISFIIPAKNESEGLQLLLRELKQGFFGAEIIVVDDGSTDATAELSAAHQVRVISHPYSKGNGAAIKTGLRAAKGKVVVCMDADGQHRAQDVSLLLAKLEEGYDMVVAARSKSGQAGAGRFVANSFYNYFSSWMVGHKIDDLTSGFRAMYRDKFIEFISLLPNKFSYPTTITMSFFRAGYSVGYVPVAVQQRLPGTVSHINLWKDGVRFLLIIFKVGTLFSPLKLFLPISLVMFVLALGYYAFTFYAFGRFTNMSALLFSTSLLVFLMGLISEQVTSLLYKSK